jgi:hypothetical protein
MPQMDAYRVMLGLDSAGRGESELAAFVARDRKQNIYTYIRHQFFLEGLILCWTQLSDYLLRTS